MSPTAGLRLAEAECAEARVPVASPSDGPVSLAWWLATVLAYTHIQT